MILNNMSRIYLEKTKLSKIYLGDKLLWSLPEFIPNNFTKLSYIESTGFQYIDTGYKPKENTTIRVGYTFTKIPSNSYYYYVFGNYNKEGLNTTRLMTSVYFNETSINMATSAGSGDLILPFVKKINTRYDDILTNSTYKTNDVKYTNENLAKGSENNKTLALFANYPGGRKSSLKLYYCEIYEDETLIYNFIPCLDANTIPCMYDTVGGNCYYNLGTEQFKYS